MGRVFPRRCRGLFRRVATPALLCHKEPVESDGSLELPQGRTEEHHSSHVADVILRIITDSQQAISYCFKINV